MSHFTCLVIGDDPEEALAPYDENISVEPYKEYWDSDNYVFWEKALRKPTDEGDPVPVLGEQYTLEEMLEVFLARYYPEEESNFGIDDGGIYEWSTYNQESHWDWWQIGGRWRGFFRTKEGALALVGDSGVFDNEARYDADQALKGDIDIEWMRTQATVAAAQSWDLVNAAIGHLPEALDWEAFTGMVKLGEMTIDEARDRYHAQERVVALRELNASLPDEEKITGLFGPDIEDFQVPRDEFIEHSRNDALCPYAYIHEGRWHAPGKMGWWANSTDTRRDRVRFAREFNELLDSLPDDTLLTLCDLHI